MVVWKGSLRRQHQQVAQNASHFPPLSRINPTECQWVSHRPRVLLLLLQARYLDLQHGTMRETSVLATVRRPGGALGERPRNAAVANQMHRVATGMLLDQSRIMADGGNIDGCDPAHLHSLRTGDFVHVWA